ncbi:MAG: nucleotidyl transferase AbiEii/AbiGii toxin family protein [Planctomycetes bacterium]|nr:nucleotidyl transferase AbiEii/AbiGii toxin family protein [Planctomycetota bacterium]
MIALEDLGHRQSFDLDFHTRAALVDTRPLLAELERSTEGGFEVVQVPDELGSGFGGLLALPGGEKIAIQVLSNYEDVPEGDLVPSTTAPPIQRVTLRRYLADKIQCVVERVEARDLFDIGAVLGARPDLSLAARRFVADQDALLLAERLTGWSEASIAEDLGAYAGVDPRQAVVTLKMLLSWLAEDARGGGST